MSIEQATLIKKIFVAALEVRADKLDAFLTEQSAGDACVHAQVLSLLQAHHSAGSFLEPEITADNAATENFSKSETDTAPVGAGALEHFRWLMLDEQPNGRIDRYKLLDVIGEGGYGIVFRARQEHPVHRIVALKVIKKGMETQAVRSRFESERQTLALMDHPNIAKLYDAGTTENDRPFFVMELVQGEPITRFCDKQRLSVRQRVGLFITVCQAVHHAHQKGIIHQDLKPSNILVAGSDKGASPKVIDFGVSQVIAGQSADSGGHQLLGTPQYMSPEQLSSRKAVIDIRSDVYSLGAVLYELLTGTPAVPKPADGATDDQTVGPPSIRVAGLVSVPGTRDLAKIADARRATVVSLQGALAEDLDWIVMKAIHPDKLFRYDSVAAFAEDLQRHLDNRPVLAAPGNFWYLCRRFVLRNKTAVIVSGVIAAAVVLSLFVVSIALVQTRQSRDRSIAAELLTAASKAQAVAKLQESYLQQARAGQRSRWPGQRINSLHAIAQAAQIAPSMELRNEAIASMSLPDVEFLQKWHKPDPNSRMGFTDQMDCYAVSDRQGAIHIYRTSDDAPVCQLPGLGRPVNDSFRFSPDGQFLAADYWPGTAALQIWDLHTLKPIFQLDYPQRVDFSHDSKCFAVGTSSGKLEIYSLPSGRLLRSIASGGMIDRLSFAPDDQKIAVYAPTGGLRLLSLSNAAITAIALEVDSMEVMAIAWHPDGQRLAICGAEAMNRIEIVNTRSGRLQCLLKGHLGAPVDLVFTHDGRYLISGGWDGRARIWEIAGGNELLSFEGFGGDLQISDDDSRVCFTGMGLEMFRLVKGDEFRTIHTALEDTQVWSADFTPDQKYLAGATCEGVRLWNFQTGNAVGFISCPGPRTVLFDKTGTSLFASTATGVENWKLTDLLHRSDPMTEVVSEARTAALAMNREKTEMVFGTRDGTLLLGDPNNLPNAKPIGQHSLPPRYLAVSPDGKWAASSVRRFDQTRTFKVWDLAARSLAAELPNSPNMVELGEVAFSPDSKILVTSDHAAYRWYSVGDWKLIHEFDRVDATFAGNLAFSPDGKLIAFSGHGYAVVIADAKTGQEFATFDSSIPHSPGPVKFSPDSTQLVMTGTSVLIWNLPLIRWELESMHLNW